MGGTRVETIDVHVREIETTIMPIRPHRQATYFRIWESVGKIPSGKVSTYGGIAHLSGYPEQPRLVGYALHGLPMDSTVPWHRVINAQGKISFPNGSRAFREQKEKLEGEGIEFIEDKINLNKYGWRCSRPARKRTR
jgi:methylated-DNA-protein-cysteine methyltransferase related protein